MSILPWFRYHYHVRQQHNPMRCPSTEINRWIRLLFIPINQFNELSTFSILLRQHLHEITCQIIFIQVSNKLSSLAIASSSPNPLRPSQNLISMLSGHIRRSSSKRRKSFFSSFCKPPEPEATGATKRLIGNQSLSALMVSVMSPSLSSCLFELEQPLYTEAEPDESSPVSLSNWIPLDTSHPWDLNNFSTLSA